MDIRHMLVVVDATREEQQPALERAAQLLEHYTEARLTLMLCDYIPALDGGVLFESHALEKARESLLAHHKSYLEQLATPLRSKGVQIDTTAIWGKRLDRHVLREVQARRPDLVLKTSHQRNPLKRLLLSAADWQLIRYCEVPLWLVKHGDNTLSQVCASVDPLHSADKPAALDNKLVACGYQLSQQLKAQLHLAHCYTPLPRTMVFDASVIADYEGYAKEVKQHHATAFSQLLARSPAEGVTSHLLEGDPEEALPGFVEEQQIDLLIMGAVSRSRLESALIGHTAERLIDATPCDLLIIKPDGFVDPSKP
ncbi:universal stress protein [Halopseudomonas pachastrellae]|uniref:universal stress protein n=1 Tax=Halopseudomonas pachastrellae TaxID=254161 RepID=UPI003D7C8E1F